MSELDADLRVKQSALSDARRELASTQSSLAGTSSELAEKSAALEAVALQLLRRQEELKTDAPSNKFALHLADEGEGEAWGEGRDCGTGRSQTMKERVRDKEHGKRYNATP